jgi:hypothetical protein
MSVSVIIHNPPVFGNCARRHCSICNDGDIVLHPEGMMYVAEREVSNFEVRRKKTCSKPTAIPISRHHIVVAIEIESVPVFLGISAKEDAHCSEVWDGFDSRFTFVKNLRICPQWLATGGETSGGYLLCRYALLCNCNLMHVLQPVLTCFKRGLVLAQEEIETQRAECLYILILCACVVKRNLLKPGQDFS